MKSDELMVGDIVLRKGKPVEIVSTSGITYSFGQQDITIYQGKGNGLESHTMRGIDPMRITEKLLMALGFASSVSPNEWTYEDSEKRIDICVDHTELDHWWVCVRHGHSKQTDNFQYFEGFADYLHLFQHILRCCQIDIGICYDKVKDL